MGTSIGPSACNEGEGPAFVANAGLFLSESFALSGFADVALPTAFGEPFAAGVGTEEEVSFVVGVESREAHIAAKLPEFPAAEDAWPKKPETDAEETLLVSADSMARVTVRVRAYTESSPGMMHLTRQLKEAREMGKRREEKQWNQGKPNCADG